MNSSESRSGSGRDQFPGTETFNDWDFDGKFTHNRTKLHIFKLEEFIEGNQVPTSHENYIIISILQRDWGQALKQFLINQVSWAREKPLFSVRENKAWSNFVSLPISGPRVLSEVNHYSNILILFNKREYNVTDPTPLQKDWILTSRDFTCSSGEGEECWQRGHYRQNIANDPYIITLYAAK